MAKYTYVSTGLSSGLGRVAKTYIDEHQKDIHHVMLCRDPSKIDKTANTTLIKCDFSSISDVKEAVEKIKSLAGMGKIPPVKLILYNAGVCTTNRTQKTQDGYERTFHVNVISPFFLVSGLLPLLKQQEGSRVFITGSDGHFGDFKHTYGGLPKPYWNDKSLDDIIFPVANPGDKNPNSMDAGSRAYTTSKLAIIYVARVFAKENPEIKFMVYHPGVIFSTGLMRDVNPVVRCVMLGLDPILRLAGITDTEPRAGERLGKTCFDDSVFAKINNVEYCDRGDIVRSSDESYDMKRADTLMKVLRNL